MKVTQKVFNEEMFAAIRLHIFSESISYEHLLDDALQDLENLGFDVENIDESKVDKLVSRFIARLEKLSDYTWDMIGE